MRCGDEHCTGNHNDRQYDTLCPRSKENKNALNRKQYAASSWRERFIEQQRVREYRMRQTRLAIAQRLAILEREEAECLTSLEQAMQMKSGELEVSI